MTGKRAAPAVDASAVGDRVVLYHRTTKKAVVLNPSGSYLWEQLSSARTSDDLVAALVERFPSLDAESARRDVEVFLAELEREGMLTTDDA